MCLEHLKVAVTGSGGFVGSHLIRELNKLGAGVIELDHRKGYDIRDFALLDKAGSFDTLVHLAAKVFVPESYRNPREFYATNLLGTLNALELCRIRGARMIFASSYVYGAPRYLPIDESHPVSGFNPYSGSKIACEQLCERYASDHGVDITILRLFNIYGPGQNERFLIPTIIRQAKEGRILLQDPKPKRDYVYIDDVSEAFCKAVQSKRHGLDVVNIGSGESFSVRTIVAEVLRNFSRKIQVEYTGEERIAEVPETIADIKKAEEILGWRPVTPFSEGVTNCVAHAP